LKSHSFEFFIIFLIKKYQNMVQVHAGMRWGGNTRTPSSRRLRPNFSHRWNRRPVHGYPRSKNHHRLAPLHAYSKCLDSFLPLTENV